MDGTGYLSSLYIRIISGTVAHSVQDLNSAVFNTFTFTTYVVVVYIRSWVL